MEPMDIVGKSKEDVTLPKATMFKIIKEMLPPDVRVARDAQDLLVECCVEFINLISSESNEVCSREDRRTISPEHVLKALESHRHVFVMKSCRNKFTTTCKGICIGGFPPRCRTFTTSTTIRYQRRTEHCEVLGFGDYIEEVYAAYEQHKLDTLDSPKCGKCSTGEMTEEEALAEQQRMFAEARARMNNGVGNAQKQLESDPALES